MQSPEMGMGGLEQKSPEQKALEQKRQMVVELGSSLHEEWRAPRKKEDGSFEPRIKKTKDEEWAKEHGTDDIDIANSSFVELPTDWQGENKAAAEVAMNEVFLANEKERILDEAFIEEASTVVHDKWLERNGEWASPELKKPFAELAEEEKEKDRAQIRKAIEIFKSSK
ncbi:MAG: hypothetical protein NTW73_03130 [Candidatus Parcubacteria bacterium]|jgi:hypothetical protein|nr:hypothetical protein [Candidatus Parcubacteria bacterium]